MAETLLSRDHEFSKLPKPQQRTHLSIASSLITLLTALAEAQDDILEAIAGNASIVRLLFLLSSDRIPDAASLRSDTLACLMILSEDNPKVGETIVEVKDPQCYETLLALRNEPTSDGVLACGVLHNVFSSLQGAADVEAAHQAADDSSLIPTLSQAVASFQPDQLATNGGGSTGWSNPVEVQQLALEILASIGMNLNASSSDGPSKKKKKEGEWSGIKDDEDMGDIDIDDDDEADGAEEDDEEDEEDEMDQDEMEADMDMVTGVDEDDDDAATANIDDLPILKALLQTALPEMVRVASSTPTNDDALRLQGHALAALNNLAWSVSLIDFSDDRNAAVRNAWTPAARSIWEQVVAPVLASDTADIELATHVTGLAWALARSFRRDATAPLAADEHRKFISLYHATKSSSSAAVESDPFQALGVKCIGVLGQLALDPAPSSLNREIGTFLITLLAALPDTAPADAVEALNQLFDIYGDEKASCDKDVFWKDNFLKHLEDVLPKARAMVKAIDKRAQSELRLRAEEAVLNLNRFLAYKRKNKPSE